MTQTQFEWIQKTAAAAKDAEHIFPDMAACEAALESNYGLSELAKNDFNLFGMKQHKHPIYGTVMLPTKECVNSQWIEVSAAFLKYPGFAECFADRMETLTRLAPVWPHYAVAVKATDPFTYISEVSKTWSTDPNRAVNVLRIYNTYQAALPKATSDLSTGDL
jgi:flagellum-specific peptidoglycan hydrolase FlgJ